MIGVLVSGTGTNLQALLDAGLPVGAVASNTAGVQALERAARASVPAAVFAEGNYVDRATRDQAMADWLDEHHVEVVVCAGYMQLLDDRFVRRFRNRILNVHPALLPAFPGLDAIGQAIAHGVRVTGVTVHFVDEGVDTGPILLQRSIELKYTRPVHEVTEEIHAVEHELLPRAIELIADGVVSFDDENPRLCRIEER